MSELRIRDIKNPSLDILRRASKSTLDEMLLEYRSKLEQAIKQNNTNVAGIAQQVIAKIREIFVERDVPENYDEIYNIDSNNFGDYPEYIAPKK